MSYLRIDASVLSVVAICDECGWRTTRHTPAAAWTACALHAKAAHDDPAAVGTARTAARMAKMRAFEKRDARSA
ncbi:hypothetical protein [Corynebacterium oculi]|uniref:Uncharacterized protein n=1 Tax=Corynebacterium oculi TaxID=1544416 RepID=A0A0N8VZV4_9CORY|nr:hypothetical protein [Corynebacterium oculi]KQB84946.1 hypothetical protein Cocul_00076 [Corynebacterium oculi]